MNIEVLKQVYGADEEELQKQQRRYTNLTTGFTDHFKSIPHYFFRAPGRTELGGNHTDHNNGKVLAAALQLDSIAAVSPTEEETIQVISEGYTEVVRINLAELEVVPEERETTTSLVRGIAARFETLGFKIGGFSAYVTSEVMPGSGLSSSASFEVLIATILNHLFNAGSVSVTEIAQIGQFAENTYFGKPCGLMDQLACATGGVISIDFKETANPRIIQTSFDLKTHDYKLLIIDTGANHAQLTDAYEAVPREMQLVAAYFKKQTLREVDVPKVLSNITALRQYAGDRAVLRAMHFFAENDRVEKLVAAIQTGNLKDYLKYVNASGDSSFKLLQNIYLAENSAEQAVSLALGLSAFFIQQTGEGACRVHGGGFAGTIQVYLPAKKVEMFRAQIEKTFGKNSLQEVNISRYGVVFLNQLIKAE